MNPERSIKRTEVKLVQTPQTFLSEFILPAYENDYQEDLLMMPLL